MTQRHPPIAAAALALAAILAGVLGIEGCGRSNGAAEPDRITVQHLLVSFAGKLPGKNVRRSQSEAKDLAEDLYDRARHGEDFDALVKQYTDDRAPGTYTMVNRGLSPAAGEYGREQMVPGFGDASFGLKVGEIGLCRYDGVRSPFGYHIIKRLQ